MKVPDVFRSVLRKALLRGDVSSMAEWTNRKRRIHIYIYINSNIQTSSGRQLFI